MEALTAHWLGSANPCVIIAPNRYLNVTVFGVQSEADVTQLQLPAFGG